MRICRCPFFRSPDHPITGSPDCRMLLCLAPGTAFSQPFTLGQRLPPCVVPKTSCLASQPSHCRYLPILTFGNSGIFGNCAPPLPGSSPDLKDLRHTSPGLTASRTPPKTRTAQRLAAIAPILPVQPNARTRERRNQSYFTTSSPRQQHFLGHTLLELP
jgi:hypothetical protein